MVVVGTKVGIRYSTMCPYDTTQSVAVGAPQCLLCKFFKHMLTEPTKEHDYGTTTFSIFCTADESGFTRRIS